MRNESHTLVGMIRRHVVEWRKAEGWSRETVAQQIVESHELLAGPQVTGIRFECKTTDAFERMKNNADRIFRWLDDETKDGNLLPANFIPSILAAMPADRRLACVDDLLRPLQMAGRRTDAAARTGELDVPTKLARVLKEDGEAHLALATLISEPTSCRVDEALKEINESIETKKQVRSVLEAAREHMSRGVRA